MSLKVKIVMTAINLSCLVITLLSPINATPLLLLTTIAATVSWAFTTQVAIIYNRISLITYVVIAAIDATACIFLGITASVVHPVSSELSQYMFQFDASLAGIGGMSFNYMIFAIFMFVSILFLMIGELLLYTDKSSNRKEYGGNWESLDSQPLDRVIKQRLRELNEKEV